MKVDYKIVRTRKGISDLLSYVYRYPVLCTDLETTSLETHSESIEIVGAGFCVKPAESFYIPFLDNTTEFNKQYILDAIQPVLEDNNLPKIGQNIKYDYRVFNRFGINIKNIKMDTMVAHYCLFSDKFGHALDEMCLNHLGHIKIRTKSVIPSKKKGTSDPTMADSPVEVVSQYCCEDVDFTYRLYEYYSYLLTLPEFAYAKKLFDNLENPLTPILAKMECNGVHINRKVLSVLKEELIDSISRLKRDINEIAGFEVTLTNPGQIGELLYNQLGLFKGLRIKPTKTGKLSTTEKTLSLVKSNPVVGNILQVKKLNKLLSTYVEPIPESISLFDDKLHASFNQHITNTGRLASSNPNLQNIPKREAIGERIRGAFVSRFVEGKILSADYSQQELRLLAHLCLEPSLVEAYKRGEDVHTNVASTIYNVDKAAVTKDQRNKTKTINYGLIYGMEYQKLSAELSITEEEAQHLIESYMSKLQNVAEFIKDSRKFLSTHGYVETMSGRRRYIPKVFSPIKYIRAAALREGPNMRVQGSAADQVKTAMIQIDPFLDGKKSKMIMQVHDELVFDVHPDELDILPTILDIMRNAMPLVVPMEVDGRFGNSWQDAH